MSSDNSNECASIVISGTTFNKEDQEFLDYIGVIYEGNASIDNCVLNNISQLKGFKNISFCIFNHDSQFDVIQFLRDLGCDIITPKGIISNDVKIFDTDDPADWWKKT